MSDTKNEQKQNYEKIVLVKLILIHDLLTQSTKKDLQCGSIKKNWTVQ